MDFYLVKFVMKLGQLFEPVSTRKVTLKKALNENKIKTRRGRRESKNGKELKIK
ncbi:hypothetical protein J7E79_16435 [Bacillus sp. ISL-40]|uniref:hypothetical protein n=1 Tax=unclassified Bacillus (in: firmicutes) TaxID=185979 RepID=UPI001BEBF908|nr:MULTISPECIES: hypothetical protein [unclassified Bacillus (in: firmicutes)]MBT2698978.1 hypothetical protein [Bacillus sp. ISL-40]MBT2721060.1 hypothetical protein [Bacillus sp. ISL-46]MBT2742622.1 hypothetical protein [Bacillus sp. ISL-77]